MTDRLTSGEQLTELRSQNSRFRTVMQGDGNLVTYLHTGWPVWCTQTAGQAVVSAVMQGDGNFVLYGAAGALWHTHTDGNPGARLVLQNDGNLVVHAPDERPLWDSKV